jgi:regulator of sirC expression with transglutaminase-like and TPR domain
MQAIKSELLELLHRNDLLRSTLFLGKVQDANFCSDLYVERIMELAARVWHRSMRSKHDPVLKAENINYTLFKDLGLIGKSEKHKNNPEDANRFYLHTVLDRKLGSPLAITVLYTIIAEQVGLECECIALPASFLLKVNDVAGCFYIDPYDSGKFLSQDEFQKKFQSVMRRSKLMSQSLYEKVNTFQLVARLIQHLKHIYILKNNSIEALRTVELLSALFPLSPEITRDRGILYCEMEYFSRAIADLKFYLQERPNAEDVQEIKKLTNMLRGYREIMN